MNNLSSYCGLVDAKIRVSDKDLPVTPIVFLQIKNTEEEEWSSKMLEVCSQNSDINLGYQLGDPNLFVKIGRFSCEISEEGYSRTLDGKNYVFV